MKFIDSFLNSVTMYRLVLYVLIFLTILGGIYSLAGIIPYNFLFYTISVIFLLVISLLTNEIFSGVYQAPTNVESVYISALILALIISPITSFGGLEFLFWAAVWTQASKYILAINKKHLFNPVAFGVALTALTINESASWWIGTLPMMPFVLAGGYLIVRKLKRENMLWAFFVTSMTVIFGFTIIRNGSLFSAFQKTIADSPWLFFAFIMLTEPLTTPPTSGLQSIYGSLTGFLFVPQIHFGTFYTTPETALLLGNIFAYLVSPKGKLILRLKERVRIAPDIYDFIFTGDRKMKFTPGQYMEWTLPHQKPDRRGNRRYFTIASSPTEEHVRIGVKFYESGSSFKKSMLRLDYKSIMVASQLAGDFVLPEKNNKKYVFIAGGIGITPFRSMIKYLLDTRQSKNIVLFNVNRGPEDIVYDDIFSEAGEKMGLKVIYTLTDSSRIPSGWKGPVGRLNSQMIIKEVPDYPQRTFYLSGPHSMVTYFEEALRETGIKKKNIVKDYFPGFA